MSLINLFGIFGLSLSIRNIDNSSLSVNIRTLQQFLPVSILSLTIQFPATNTASHCMIHPYLGISITSPGTRSSEEISIYSAKNVQFLFKLFQMQNIENIKTFQIEIKHIFHYQHFYFFKPSISSRDSFPCFSNYGCIHSIKKTCFFLLLRNPQSSI